MKKKEADSAPTRTQIVAVVAIAALGAITVAGALWWDKRRATDRDPDTVIVYKNPDCECCSRWVKHLREAGFKVEVQAEFNLDARNRALGVPQPLAACHTALVHDYLIVGHVPAADIRRLLQQKPDAKGLAVPGMPVGSPGMEMGDRVDAYDVVLFGADGRRETFSHHSGPAAAPSATDPTTR